MVTFLFGLISGTLLGLWWRASSIPKYKFPSARYLHGESVNSWGYCQCGCGKKAINWKDEEPISIMEAN